MKKIYLFGVMGLVIALDQLSKLWALKHLVLGWPEKLFSGFNFTLAYNRGVAFSAFYDTGRQSPWFLILMTSLLSVMVLLMLIRTPKAQFQQRMALSMVLAGALSNLVDRIHYGAVVDFIDVYIGQYHWPVFNIADSAICLGAFLLLLSGYRDNKNQCCQQSKS
jgi:signal peptidase II